MSYYVKELNLKCEDCTKYTKCTVEPDKKLSCLKKRAYLGVVRGFYKLFNNQDEWKISDCNVCLHYLDITEECYHQKKRKNKRGFCEFFKHDYSKNLGKFDYNHDWVWEKNKLVWRLPLNPTDPDDYEYLLSYKIEGW